MKLLEIVPQVISAIANDPILQQQIMFALFILALALVCHLAAFGGRSKS